MKSRSCGLVQRIGTADSATPHPDPCGGQAPALHFLIPPSAIGLQFGNIRRWRAGIEVDWRAHSRTNRSCRPAAGTPGYENWVHWSMEGFRCRLCPPSLPWLGISPSPTFALWTRFVDSGLSENYEVEAAPARSKWIVF